MAGHFVVMGDIVRSRDHRQETLMDDFARLVAGCNRHFAVELLSPCTITLGDEFQGVADSLLTAVRTALYLEEARLRGEVGFQLRHAVHFGEIATPLNPLTAHGMLGPGLTQARALLSDKRRGRSRFSISLPDAGLALRLGRLLDVMAALARDWKARDAALIFAMLDNERDTEVAAELGKTRSQIWKRRRSLLIDEYRALRELLLDLAGRES
jgi:hypothetical protein